MSKETIQKQEESNDLNSFNYVKLGFGATVLVTGIYAGYLYVQYKQTYKKYNNLIEVKQSYIDHYDKYCEFLKSSRSDSDFSDFLKNGEKIFPKNNQANEYLYAKLAPTNYLAPSLEELQAKISEYTKHIDDSYNSLYNSSLLFSASVLAFAATFEKVQKAALNAVNAWQTSACVHLGLPCDTAGDL